LQISFWGAAKTVTGSMHLLDVNGSRILLDCGLYQGRREESLDRNRSLPFDASQITSVVLSHAHIDHSGNIPNLVKSGYGGSIYATAATRDLARAMLLDSGQIQESDVFYVNKRRRKQGLPPAEAIYTKADAQASLKQLVSVAYHEPFVVAPGVSVTFFDAGHILGSAVTVLDVNEGSSHRRLCFTGDLGRKRLRIIRDPEVPPDVDCLICESTYGDRQHTTTTDARSRLCDIISQTIQRRGKVIIPAFAVGRTQEVVYELHELIQGGSLPHLPVYVDSPLAINVTKVFRNHRECYDAELRALLEKDQDPFGFYRLQYTRTVEESKKLNELREPAIIISASGMCEAGRVLHHLKNNVGDERNTILFVGFQAPETLGRKLVDGWKTVPIFGEKYTVRARVEFLDGFSAHADRDELRTYIRALTDQGHVRHAVAVHGDEPACEAVAQTMRDLGIANVLVPERGQQMIL
jgi:metallo-beta-lactamase family protein